MSRKTEDSIYKGPVNKRPQQETLLGIWLKAHSISKDQFGRLVGCAPKMVDFWCAGRCIPGLLYAFKIEQVTGGGIGVETWLGLDIAKLEWNRIQRRAKTQ